MVSRQKTGHRGLSLGHGLYFGFHGKGKQGRVNNLGLASLNNFRGFEAMGVIPSYLAPSSGIFKAEKYCLLGVEAR